MLYGYLSHVCRGNIFLLSIQKYKAHADMQESILKLLIAS